MTEKEIEKLMDYNYANIFVLLMAVMIFFAFLMAIMQNVDGVVIFSTWAIIMASCSLISTQLEK